MQLLGRSVLRDVRKTVFQVRTFMMPITPRNTIQILRLADKRLRQGVHVPTSVVLSVTRSCQMKCVHCFVSDKELNDRMETDRMKALIDDLARWGVLKVVFFGGEPTMRDDLFELMEHTARRGLRLGMNTNGLLLDRAYCERLSTVGISNVGLSLDSPDRKVHDALRRHPGSYDAALRALAELRRVGIPVMISTYASHKNVSSGSLARLIDLARSQGATGVTVLPAVLGGSFKKADGQKLTPEDMETIFSLADPDFVFLEDTYTVDRPEERKCMCAKKEVLYISPEGEVQPCPSIPISFGNTNQRPVIDIAKWMWDDQLFKMKNQSCDGCIVNDPTFRKEQLDPVGDATVELRYEGRAPVYVSDNGGALPPCGIN